MVDTVGPNALECFLPVLSRHKLRRQRQSSVCTRFGSRLQLYRPHELETLRTGYKIRTREFIAMVHVTDQSGLSFTRLCSTLMLLTWEAARNPGVLSGSL